MCIYGVKSEGGGKVRGIKRRNKRKNRYRSGNKIKKKVKEEKIIIELRKYKQLL